MYIARIGHLRILIFLSFSLDVLLVIAMKGSSPLRASFNDKYYAIYDFRNVSMLSAERHRSGSFVQPYGKDKNSFHHVHTIVRNHVYADESRFSVDETWRKPA